MRVDHFPEPQLEFGDGATHIDVRFGIANYGPTDKDTTLSPKDLKIGIVGTEETVQRLRSWLAQVKGGVPAKKSRRPNLFPPFPGFTKDTCFGSEIVTHHRWSETIPKREIEDMLAVSQTQDLVKESVDLFLSAGEDIMQEGGPQVLVCAPPADLLAALDVKHSPRALAAASDVELDEGSEESPQFLGHPQATFHDLLKARGMSLSVPIQMIRPGTYQQKKSRTRHGPTHSRRLQDEATRAWNLHTALYYKAGGIPWRLPRDPSALTSCFIGISFYRSPDGERLLTSVAQIFNERGEGVVIRGGVAHLDKNDRQPRLTGPDSYLLLRDALEVYRREHKTLPARLVLHKTSSFSDDEIRGLVNAASEMNFSIVELLWLRRSFTRMLRKSVYPPLRGTFLELTGNTAIIYLRGSVDFFRTYPGMYVPRPIEFELAKGESPLESIGREMMDLSKLNWNNTQFDGGEPMTLRAARKVGDILKWMPPTEDSRHSFRFFM